MSRILLPIILLFMIISVAAQDIVYTNDNIQLVDELNPDAGVIPTNEQDFALHGSWTSQFRYNNVIGQEDDSLKDEGFFHSHALQLNLQTRLVNDIFLQINFAGRYDDQPSAAADPFNLDNLQIVLYKPNVFELQFGDISPQLSHYTLEQTLEGFLGKYFYSLGEERGINFTAVVGQVPRDFGGGDQRIVTAYRAEFKDVIPGVIFGFDQVFVNDRGTQVGQDVSVASFNGLWIVPFVDRLETYWDVAFSYNLQDSGANIPSQQDGFAMRYGMRYQGGNQINFQMEYEEVSPDFVSPVSAGGTDRRVFLISGGLPLLHNLSFQGSYSFTRDNLYGQLEQTTRTHRTDMSLRYKPWNLRGEEIMRNLELTQNVGYTQRFDKVNVESEILDFTTAAVTRFLGFDLQLSYAISLFRDVITDDTDFNNQNFQGRIGYSTVFWEGDLQFNTNLNMRISDELFRRENREHNINRVYGWQTRGLFYNQYELVTNLEYQRITKPGDNFEGEIYSAILEGRYTAPLKVGSLNISILVEYTVNNFDLEEEEFDDFRVLGNLTYSF